MREKEGDRKEKLTASDYRIERITSDNKFFRQAVSILRKNFPPELLGDIENFADNFSKKEREKMYPDQVYMLAAKDRRGNVKGVTIFNYLDRVEHPDEKIGSGIAYGEYIAVSSDAQGSGLGSRLFIERIARIHKDGYKPSAFVWEVAKPNPELQSLDKISVAKRLKFFERLGGKVIAGIDYKMPTYTHYREIPAYLLIRSLRKNLPINRWYVKGIVYAIIYDVFRYDLDISESRADELYQEIIKSMDNKRLRLVNPTQVL